MLSLALLVALALTSVRDSGATSYPFLVARSAKAAAHPMVPDVGLPGAATGRGVRETTTPSDSAIETGQRYGTRLDG
jgi:hypothetical protein